MSLARFIVSMSSGASLLWWGSWFKVQELSSSSGVWQASGSGIRAMEARGQKGTLDLMGPPAPSIGTKDPKLDKEGPMVDKKGTPDLKGSPCPRSDKKAMPDPQGTPDPKDT